MTMPAASDTPLAVRALCKDYGSFRALDSLSFEARRGEILGVLGPNGAGKTTALHILMGILRPTAGEVRLFGLSPFKDKYKIYPRINFSSAYVQLPYNLLVRKNLDIYARLYGVGNRASKIEELLSLFDLGPLAERETGSLSSGEQTRLNLCKSFLNDPELLFLDEPTASLDPDIADRVRQILKRVQAERRMTIIYTSHNMPEVEDLCDRVLFLSRGKKIIEGSAAQVQEQFQQESLEKVFIHVARGGDLKPLGEESAR